MIIKRIRIQNYKTYLSLDLDLSVKADCPIILIGGMNGGGKTTLFEAICGALYGLKIADKAHFQELLNNGGLGKVEPTIMLELSFEGMVLGQVQKYLLRRTYKLNPANKPVESVTLNMNGTPFTYGTAMPPSQRAEQEQQVNKIIKANLPQELSKYFLFDAMQSSELLKENVFAQIIKDNIQNVMGFNKYLQLKKDWKTYPVFHIDFNGKNFVKAGELEDTLLGFVEGIEAQYGRDPYHNTLGDRFAYALKAAHEQTGLRCVVLVDEYDKPLLDVMGLPETIRQNNVDITLEENHRNILKGFYSTFKLADNDLQFVLLMGVTKFSQISLFSGFNQPNDISMAPQFETLCGITDEELQSYFHEQIQELANSNGYTYEEMMNVLRKRFDGYHFGPRLKGVYNPFSILNTFSKMIIRDYWFRTGTPTYLVRLLQDNHENLNDLAGKYYDESEFVDYCTDRKKPLPLIYQNGYLTIKDYDREMRTYLLDFPNDEVKKGFVTMTANSYLATREDTGSWVRSAVIALKRGEVDKFKTLLTSFLASIPYTARRKENETEKERYFSYTLYLIFRIASCYITYIEKEQSYGRLDCCVETPKYVYIFEFKLDSSAEEALRQIDDRGYATEFLSSGKTIYKIGVNISSETGTVADLRIG